MYFTLGYSLFFDLRWESTYTVFNAAGNPLRPSMSESLEQDGTGWHSELFGAQIVGEGGAIAGFELFKFWKYYGRFTLDVMRISPFILEVYAREIMDLDQEMQDMHMGVAGYYDLRVGEFWIFHDEQMKTCSQSVVDSVITPSPAITGWPAAWAVSCMYSTGLPNIMEWMWVDPIYYFSLTEMLIMSGEPHEEEEVVEEEGTEEGDGTEEAVVDDGTEEEAAPALR